MILIPTPHRIGLRVQPIALPCAAMAALILLSACSKPAEPLPTPPPRVVQVATVREGSDQPAIIVSGTTANRDEARLSFKIGGVVDSVSVREGDLVKKGQLLATIEVAEIDAQVEQARAAAQKANRDLERARTLFSQDVVTREQLDDLGTANAVAQAQLRAANFNRRHSEILAPDNGRVMSRLLEPRELVQAGAPVLVVGNDQGGVVLKAALADRDALRVQLGDAAEIVFDALPAQRFKATVREISQTADLKTGTYAVELGVDPAAAASDSAALPSGLIGRATIIPSRTTGAMSTRVPLASLIEGDQRKALVYRYDPDTSTVQAVQVSIGFLDGEEAVLASALPPGTQLVTNGAAYLNDGDKVRLVIPEKSVP